MADLEVRFDQEQIRKAIGTLNSLSDQVPFALSVAINRTLEEASAALRKTLPKKFIFREPRMVNLIAPRIIPRDQRASKTHLAGRIFSKDFSALLAPFETGEPHRQKRGVDGRENPVIIPTTRIQPSRTVRVPRSLYPIHLGLVARRTINPRREGPYYYALGRGSLGGLSKGKKGRRSPIHRTSGGKLQIKGKRGTFVLNELTAPALDPKKYGVYQRDGGKVRMLWAFRREVPRPAVLDFDGTVAPIAQARLGVNFVGAFEFAQRTARS